MVKPQQHQRKLTKEEDGEMKLFSKDVESPDKYEVEKLGQTREEIYEKYAQKAGMDVNELKDRLEAYKSQKEATINVKTKADIPSNLKDDDVVNVGDMDM